jgi:hypothetical protein
MGRMEDTAASVHAGDVDEYVDILAKRVIHSNAHTCLCGSMIVAGTIEVAWTLLPHGGVGQLPHHPFFVFVGVYITLGLVGELVLRAALQRHDFFRRRVNLIDGFVAPVSVVSLILFGAGLETPGEMMFAEAIVIARIAFRFLRCYSLTKTFQRQQQVANSKLDIVLADVELGDGGEMASMLDSDHGGHS